MQMLEVLWLVLCCCLPTCVPHRKLALPVVGRLALRDAEAAPARVCLRVHRQLISCGKRCEHTPAP